jgi:CoA-transferase family III
VKRILPVVAQMGDRLCGAARAIGGTIAFDAKTALVREHPEERSCRLIETADGWIAVNLARAEDVSAVPAWLGCALNAEPWEAITRIAKRRICAELIEQAILLGMPVSVLAESGPLSEANSQSTMAEQILRQRSKLRVLDLSALWAGPYCGGLLAEAGAIVTKIESQTRRDPTPHSDPKLDQRLNGRKKRVSLDFANGGALLDMVTASAIMVTSARAHALARLGLTEERVFDRNPNLIWVAITAYGWRGDAGMRVGFGDDCAAAGGLVGWQKETPHFLGDALADPLTGITAATRALEALAQGRPGLIDVSLSQTAARVAAAAGLKP